MLHDRNPAYDPLSSASMFSRFKMVDKLLLEAIENLSDRKIRPNFENIAKFMNCHFSTAEAEVFDELNFLLRKELIVEVSFKNVKSFRVASKWNRPHLGCQREQVARIKRLIHQAIRTVVDGKYFGKTVLNPSDLESSPECGARAKTLKKGGRTKRECGWELAESTATDSDRSLLGASIDEIYGFVSMKYTDGKISKAKLNSMIGRQIQTGKVKLLEDGNYRLSKIERVNRRRSSNLPDQREASSIPQLKSEVDDTVPCLPSLPKLFASSQSFIEDSFASSFSPFRLPSDVFNIVGAKSTGSCSDAEIAYASVDSEATSADREWSDASCKLGNRSVEFDSKNANFASHFRNLDDDHREDRKLFGAENRKPFGAEIRKTFGAENRKPFGAAPVSDIPSLSRTPASSPSRSIESKECEKMVVKVETPSEENRSCQRRCVVNWTVEDVAKFFSEQGMPTACTDVFSRELIDGRSLLLLSREDVLGRLGLKVGIALKAFRLIRALQLGYRPCARTKWTPNSLFE